ncbi:hypothetical protein A5N78_04720 [Prescottella equi]|uniref:hypothetical protein n=1 Tax=Rhodococcus hoagii TaxID=43767 RepID=UPI000A118CC4|nr:hypothetical protein [Prescottella equi]ORL93442.1 hypothetical protein A5N78_04720 [Prescottella equi]ORM17795.1 hypothetical protein A5N70_11295 [Prescottella equi]
MKKNSERQFDYDSDARLGFVPETAPEMARAAARTVASNATDAQDAKTLLSMLGLLEAPAVEPEVA